MRFIHTSIVSRHLATIDNNKILRTPPPHIISSKDILPRLTRRTLAQLFLKVYLHKVDAKTHPSPLCHLCNIHTHDTHHLFNCTHIRIVTPGFVDRPRRSECTAGQMDGEAGWWTTSGKIRLPHQHGLCDWVDNNNMMGRWADDACWVVHDVRLYSVLDTVVISGECVCCSVVFWNSGWCVCV